MRQLGLSDVSYPTPILNDNRGSIDWIESGCKPTKKLRHENLAELGIAEAKRHGEVSFLWMPGVTNPSDLFTKEDNDVQHYCSLRDLMVVSREDFLQSQINRWGVLKRESCDPVTEETKIETNKPNGPGRTDEVGNKKSNIARHTVNGGIYVGSIFCPPIG